jgi:EpsI family protein
MLIVCAVLLVTVSLRTWLAATPAIPLREPLAKFPDQIAEWRLVREDKIDEETLAVLKADDYMQRAYQNSAGQPAGLFVAYYRTQHAGESMHSPQNCMPGSGWEPVQHDRISMGTDAASRPMWVNRYVVEKDGERALLLYWYQENGRIIASEYWGKVYMIWDTLRTGRRDGAIVRLTVPVPANGDSNEASAAAQGLATLCLPHLRRFLPN